MTKKTFSLLTSLSTVCALVCIALAACADPNTTGGEVSDSGKTSTKEHTHNLKLIGIREATCTENGVKKEHYKCSVCDKLFEDKNGEQEIADKTRVETPKLAHEYDDYGWCKHCGHSKPNYTESLVEYKYDEESGSYYVSGISDSEKAVEVTIKSEINGKPVMGISSLDGYSNLKSVAIPASVTSIDGSAFFGCKSLEGITIASGNPKYHVKNNCIIETATNALVASCSDNGIPDGVKIIYPYAFAASILTEITIPDSVTSIGDLAFYYCIGLTSITIPNSVTSIGYMAFGFCESLTEIMIPDSVTSIGEIAFNGTGITSITIPDSVTSIGDGAFINCGNLTSVTVASGNSTYHAKNNCIIETATKTLIAGCKNSVIPTDGSITKIGNYVFEGHDLKSVTIPDGVTSIEKRAFYGCSGLTSVTLPDSVTSIGEGAFDDCSGLTNIKIPDNVTSIGDDAFDGCENLTSITIGKNVVSIGSKAFSYCNNLETVYWNATAYTSTYGVFYISNLKTVVIGDNVTSIGNSVFNNCNLTSINYMGDLKDWCDMNGVSGLMSNSSSNKTLTIGGKEITGELIIPDGVTNIEKHAFYGCSGITSVTIPNNVTSIGESAFNNCSDITSITIGEGVTSIGSGALGNCSNLKTVYWNAIACADAYDVFLKCENIETVIFGNNVTLIPEYFLCGCKKLTNITIPNSVTEVGNSAFSGCNNLTSVTIGKNVTSIGRYAFARCTGLTNITIPDSVTNIGEDAFARCTGLTNITIPDSVTNIGEDAFWDCTSLEEITLPFVGASKDAKDNTHFGYIFGAQHSSYNKSYVPQSLKSVIITGGNSIGSSAFSDCSGITSVTIPDSVTSIGEYAFSNCKNLTSIFFKGTERSWNEIEKGNWWDYYHTEDGLLHQIEYTIYFTDDKTI